MLKFRLEKFEGPLALLLQLIEREEMDITEVSLAKITNQYIEYIRNSSKLNKIKPDEMADFLVVASKLLLIKSRALLPYLYPEEEREINDFEEQIKMYKEFLEASKRIDEMINKKRFMFGRQFNRQAILAGANIFSPPVKLKAIDLNKIFNDLINKIRPLQILEEQEIKNTITIEEKIFAIQQLLINRIKLSFNKILARSKDKIEIIVSFLALLELTKQKNITVVQENLFGEIEINKI